MTAVPAAMALVGWSLVLAATPAAVQDPSPSAAPVEVPITRPVPRLETAAVASAGDAADDPALWVHPEDPARSLILATDKQRALMVYDLEGREVAVVGEGLSPNNVDVRQGCAFGERKVDIAVASVRGEKPGLMVWTIDPASGELSAALDAPLPALAGGEPYGCCLYRRVRDRALFAFVTAAEGRIQQWRLRDGPDGKVSGECVRSWRLDSEAEGCCADDDHGWLFVAEEDVAIWRYGAEPDGPTGPAHRVGVLAAAGGGFTPDVEGLDVYRGRDGGGYLVASLQGENRLALLDRRPPHRLVAYVDPAASATIDDVSDSDGIVAASAALGPRFPHGVLVVQDGDNAPHAQNFKVFAWEDVVSGLAAAIEPARPVR